MQSHRMVRGMRVHTLAENSTRSSTPSFSSGAASKDARLSAARSSPCLRTTMTVQAMAPVTQHTGYEGHLGHCCHAMVETSHHRFHEDRPAAPNKR